MTWKGMYCEVVFLCLLGYVMDHDISILVYHGISWHFPNMSWYVMETSPPGETLSTVGWLCSVDWHGTKHLPWSGIQLELWSLPQHTRARGKCNRRGRKWRTLEPIELPWDYHHFQWFSHRNIPDFWTTPNSCFMNTKTYQNHSSLRRQVELLLDSSTWWSLCHGVTNERHGRPRWLMNFGGKFIGISTFRTCGSEHEW